MTKKLNLINQVFGLLTVISEVKERSFGAVQCLCLCSCGNKTIVRSSRLKSGGTKSCGCLQKENASKASKKHGFYKHPVYFIWSAIIQRCHNKNSSGYKYCGSRGITVCSEWRNNPKAFIEWSLANGWKQGLAIDRNNNDLGYNPGNCHYITQQENNKNTQLIRSNNTSGYRGAYKRRKGWLASVGINNKCVHIGLFKTAVEAAKARDKYVIDNNLNLTLNFK